MNGCPGPDCNFCSPTVPQQVALTAFRFQVSACVWVMLVEKNHSVRQSCQEILPVSSFHFFGGPLKGSQLRHPQREALMPSKHISGSIWGGLNVNFRSCLQHVLPCKTAPTSSTYWIEQSSWCSGWVNIVGRSGLDSSPLSSCFFHVVSQQQLYLWQNCFSLYSLWRSNFQLTPPPLSQSFYEPENCGPKASREGHQPSNEDVICIDDWSIGQHQPGLGLQLWRKLMPVTFICITSHSAISIWNQILPGHVITVVLKSDSLLSGHQNYPNIKHLLHSPKLVFLLG